MAQHHPQQRALRSSTKQNHRASRHARLSVSYREPSSESEIEADEEKEDDLDDNINVKKQSKRHRAILRSTPNKRRRQASQSPSYSKKGSSGREREKLDVENRELSLSRTKPNKLEAHSPSNSTPIIPPWSSLPYHILLQIFKYASFPLYDERTFQAQVSVDWLLKISTLCRSFTEPALTVLYCSPPLVPMGHAHKLREILMADPASMSYNYRSKVEQLQMEISQTAAYTLPGHGLLDLHGLIYNCPRLLDLELYHQKDLSPYRRLDETVKWSYPETLFKALNKNVTGCVTNLRSWRWSSRMAGKRWPIDSLLGVHKNPSFAGLRKIAFVNYQKPLTRKTVADPKHEKLLADSLSVLSLDHLIFESSTLVNKILLPLLPTNLKHLELINCWEVTSEEFTPFLLTHGNTLRSLTLNHNPSLNLSFLTVLGNACPELEILKMNLTYYNVHSTYHNSEPWYVKLLGVDEIPSWPASLQSIELTQLRSWDIETAKMFFQSLLHSAPSLVNLRRLIIKAIINTSWRDRSSFRDEWVGAFTRVFKRRWTPPNQHLQFSGACSAFKNQHQKYDNVAVDESERQFMAPSLPKQDPHATTDQNRLESPPTSNLGLGNGSRIPSPRKSSNSMANQENWEDRRDNGIGQVVDEPDVSTKTRQSSRLALIKSSHESVMHDSVSNRNQSDAQRPSQREFKRKGVIDRELELLRKTAGIHQPQQDSGAGSHNSYSDSDDEPLGKRISKNAEIIQGLCDTVFITIDNLRPTETQFVEADFLDSEPEGDEDWDGTEDVGDTRYAW